MFVVVVVPVSPHLEGEVDVEGDEVSEKFIEPDGLEEGEVGHVVVLHEDANYVETVDGPAQVVGPHFDEEDCHHLDQKGDAQAQEGFGVAGSDVLVYMFVQLCVELVLTVAFSHCCHLSTNYTTPNKIPLKRTVRQTGESNFAGREGLKLRRMEALEPVTPDRYPEKDGFTSEPLLQNI